MRWRSSAGRSWLHCGRRANLEEIAKILSDSYGVMCRTGHMRAQPFVDRFTDDEVLRVSGYVYNDHDDISLLFSALDAVVMVVGAGR